MPIVNCPPFSTLATVAIIYRTRSKTSMVFASSKRCVFDLFSHDTLKILIELSVHHTSEASDQVLQQIKHLESRATESATRYWCDTGACKYWEDTLCHALERSSGPRQEFRIAERIDKRPDRQAKGRLSHISCRRNTKKPATGQECCCIVPEYLCVPAISTVIHTLHHDC